MSYVVKDIDIVQTAESPGDHSRKELDAIRMTLLFQYCSTFRISQPEYARLEASVGNGVYQVVHEVEKCTRFDLTLATLLKQIHSTSNRNNVHPMLAM